MCVVFGNFVLWELVYRVQGLGHCYDHIVWCFPFKLKIILLLMEFEFWDFGLNGFLYHCQNIHTKYP